MHIKNLFEEQHNLIGSYLDTIDYIKYLYSINISNIHIILTNIKIKEFFSNNLELLYLLSKRNNKFSITNMYIYYSINPKKFNCISIDFAEDI